jgi:O-antigen ligase
MAAIIAIFFLIVIFYKNLKKHIKILFIILLTILSFLIWYMQSRGTILCYYSIILFIIFLARKVNFRKKIFFFFLIIIFPISSNYVYFKINQKFVENKIVANENKLNPRIIENKTTSGRLILWSEILKNYDFQKIFGYGPQADRLLLKGETNELGNTYGNNASNGFVYAFACGGYLGLLFYILINIQILIFIYKSVLINKIFSKNNLIYVKLSITYLLFFFY